MIDLAPENVPTSRPGEEWGLGVYASHEIELIGDPIEGFINRSFNIKKTASLPAPNNRGVLSVIKNVFTARPVIDPHRCVCCGVCVKVCPVQPKALSWQEGKMNPPRYTYRNCIRCFCCQELCPERAIQVKTPPLGRLVFGEK
jgi:formate hydrogenlyase subunit 6/NADH:ubiquinone oxidoreductase subunit I